MVHLIVAGSYKKSTAENSFFQDELFCSSSCDVVERPLPWDKGTIHEILCHELEQPHVNQRGGARKDAPRLVPDMPRLLSAPTQVPHPDLRLPRPKNRRCAPWFPGMARR